MIIRSKSKDNHFHNYVLEILLSLWGIEINPAEIDKHVTFKKLRNFKNEHYERFWEMLKGNFTQ